MPHTILVVDDDPHIREVTVFALEKAGYATVAVADGRQALQAAAAYRPALIVLDIGMPEMDGLDVCRMLRKSSEVPILFLSARDDEVDKVVGLEIGGDDYMTKPFSPRELTARVQAILKRSAPLALSGGLVQRWQQGGLTLDGESRAAGWRGRHVELTATEFDLLQVLMQHPQRVFSRDELMDRAYQNITVSDRTIDSHVRHIRSKFSAVGSEEVIATVHGVGYRLGPCDAG